MSRKSEAEDGGNLKNIVMIFVALAALMGGCTTTRYVMVPVPTPVEVVRERTVYVHTPPPPLAQPEPRPADPPPSRSHGSVESIRVLREAARCFDPPAGSALEAECRSRRRSGDSLDALEGALEDYDRRD